MSAALLFSCAMLSMDAPNSGSSASSPSPAATDGATPTPSNTPEIIVSAKSTEEFQKLDKKVYAIPRDPSSQNSDAIALLRGLPSITIGREDVISLLGNSNVTILIDGKPAPGGKFSLLGLRGAEIDHIEVMTNPSVESGAEGTGGIINIVRKKITKRGLSGSSFVQADSFGGYQLSFSPKYLVGPLTFDTQIAYRHVIRKIFSESTTIAEGNGASPNLSYDDTRAGRANSRFIMASETAEYRMSDKSTFGLDAYIGRDRVPRRTSESYFGTTSVGTSDFVQDTSDIVHSLSRTASLIFSRKNPSTKDSTQLRAEIDTERVSSRRDESISYTTGNEDNYEFDNVFRRNKFTLTGDQVKNLAGVQVISFGFNAYHVERDYSQALDNQSAIPSLGPSARGQSNVTRDVFAVYASFQKKLEKFEILPAIRMEKDETKVSSSATSRGSNGTFSVFPSIHVSRSIGKHLKTNLSYARRIDRPQLDQLSPIIALTSTTSGASGNENLRSQKVDSFEFNTSFTEGSASSSLLLYHRIISNLWTSEYASTPNGLIVSNPINFGKEVDYGAQFDGKAKILPSLKSSLSINLFQSNVPGLEAGEKFRQLRYTGNASLDWSISHGGKSIGNIQTRLNYQGKRRVYQSTYSSELSCDVTTTVKLGETLSASLTAENLVGRRYTRQSFNAPSIQQTFSQRNFGPRVALKIVKRLGK